MGKENTNRLSWFMVTVGLLLGVGMLVAGFCINNWIVIISGAGTIWLSILHWDWINSQKEHSNKGDKK